MDAPTKKELRAQRFGDHDQTLLEFSPKTMLTSPTISFTKDDFRTMKNHHAQLAEYQLRSDRRMGYHHHNHCSHSSFVSDYEELRNNDYFTYLKSQFVFLCSG